MTTWIIIALVIAVVIIAGSQLLMDHRRYMTVDDSPTLLNRLSVRRGERIAANAEKHNQLIAELQKLIDRGSRLRALRQEYRLIHQRHANLLVDWAQMESDPATVLTHPLLRQVTVDEIAQFHEQRTAAEPLTEATETTLNKLSDRIGADTRRSLYEGMHRRDLDALVRYVNGQSVNRWRMLRLRRALGITSRADLLTDADIRAAEHQLSTYRRAYHGLRTAWSRALDVAATDVLTGLSTRDTERAHKLLERAVFSANDHEASLSLSALEKLLRSAQITSTDAGAAGTSIAEIVASARTTHPDATEVLRRPRHTTVLNLDQYPALQNSGNPATA